ncbi:hypothetical protein [Rhodoferax sp.]|uniref:hypothetical protein n=1 Tax=Rhodoferax sp. TaxID=50421 RepID=UPI002755C66F|nr:hypothetical protein [Rhodoferax sp.]
MTSKKIQYQYRIFKKYSILVDFDGEPRRENVPAAVEGETFKHWRLRVLGDGVTNLTVFGPHIPAQQTTMVGLKKWADNESLERMFGNLANEKNRVRKEGTERVKAVERSFVGFSKNTLAVLLDELGDSLEGATKEFFGNFQNSTDADIDTEQMLRELILKFNTGVRQLRVANAANAANLKA